MLHYYAMRGNVEATRALLKYGDMNTTIAGRTVFEAALDSGNNTLCSIMMVYNPSVVAIVREGYKEKVHGNSLGDLANHLTESQKTNDVARETDGGQNSMVNIVNGQEFKDIIGSLNQQEEKKDVSKSSKKKISYSQDDINIKPSSSPEPREFEKLGVTLGGYREA